jgi:Zn-dependent peptidase ImmA (M78 family)
MPKQIDPTNEASVLKTLRDLVPRRRLSYHESLQLAELQANRLLELFEVTGPLVPDELITELPRVAVRYDDALPVSASAHWEGGRWFITLNASEPHVRQRFSLMHEFKHILDHTTKDFLYGTGDANQLAAERAERAADAFAAALLMPKRWIKSCWYESGQNLAVVANRAGVSTRALSVRLYHLGIAPQTPRCPQISRPNVNRRKYHRYTPQLAGATP